MRQVLWQLCAFVAPTLRSCDCIIVAFRSAKVCLAKALLRSKRRQSFAPCEYYHSLSMANQPILGDVNAASRSVAATLIVPLPHYINGVQFRHFQG